MTSVRINRITTNLRAACFAAAGVRRRSVLRRRLGALDIGESRHGTRPGSVAADHGRALSRPARRTVARSPECRRGDLEPEENLAHVPSPENFVGVTNSDLAFYGTNVIHGNYNGFEIWDISNPAQPRLRLGTSARRRRGRRYGRTCSSFQPRRRLRLDRGKDAPREAVSKDRFRGLRIFDISDIDHPKYIANVQICRGSHTRLHGGPRSERQGQHLRLHLGHVGHSSSERRVRRCKRQPVIPNNSNFRIEVIKIPLAHPEQAAVVSSPAIFADPTTGNALLYAARATASPADSAANRARAQFDARRAQKLEPAGETAVDSRAATQKSKRRQAVRREHRGGRTAVRRDVAPRQSPVDAAVAVVVAAETRPAR